MKKMLILIGLLALAVLVVSCAREGAVAGEATKFGGTRAGELQRVCPSGCDLDTKITALDLDCKSFTNLESLNEDLGLQSFDRVCEVNGYDECVGVTYWGTYGDGPFTPEEKIGLTFSMPGSCELSYQGERNSVASYFGNEVTWQDFGININVGCCRIR